LGPLQYPDCDPSAQEAECPPSRFRCRLCLLKGCERMFRPSRPQCRFCSEACGREGKRWRSRRAAGLWRGSERGKECRQAQSRRYRRLIPLVLIESPIAAAVPLEPAPGVEAREGQRPAPILDDLSVRMCKRPGCYELFGVTTECSLKSFCSAACRKALRRVLAREAGYRRCRLVGIRPRCRRSRPAPKPRKRC
jgi:hypothetical protein